MRIKLAIGKNTWHLITEEGQIQSFNCHWNWPEPARKLSWIPNRLYTFVESICAADWFLITHVGQSFEDPGYFEKTLQ